MVRSPHRPRRKHLRPLPVQKHVETPTNTANHPSFSTQTLQNKSSTPTTNPREAYSKAEAPTNPSYHVQDEVHSHRQDRRPRLHTIPGSHDLRREEHLEARRTRPNHSGQDGQTRHRPRRQPLRHRRRLRRGRIGEDPWKSAQTVPRPGPSRHQGPGKDGSRDKRGRIVTTPYPDSHQQEPR